jgi:hypothetical protein
VRLETTLSSCGHRNPMSAWFTEEHMTRCILIFALIAAFLLPTVTLAEATDAPVALEASEEPGWDQFDDPSFDPAAVSEAVTDEPSDGELLESGAVGSRPDQGVEFEFPAAPRMTRGSGTVLGPHGIDDQGRAGRLHSVVSGDTLWDLTAAYLGTPWVWPSVWIDNDNIDNPHLILPGDKIWITANEMRVVTDAEGQSYLVPGGPAAADDFDPMMEPDGSTLDGSTLVGDSLAGSDEAAPLAAFEGMNPDESSTLATFPVIVPGAAMQPTSGGRRITIARRESMGFVTSEQLDGASTIVGSPVERVYLAAGDDVILGAGEGEVEIGDQFTIFQVVEEVRDPESLQLLGHHVDRLGWIEVKELTGDTSIGQIRTSNTEIARGTQIMRRKLLPRTVDAHSTPDAIEGIVMFLPFERTMMGDGGYLYINRGEFHGLETGSELEVYDSGSIVVDQVRRVEVRTPDHVVAQLIVVSLQPDSAVAFVLSANRELEVGDSVRPRIRTLAQR